MFFKLLALFTIVPLIELALLIPLGMQIGLWPTIALVVATALLGAFLGKHEGSRALAAIKSDLNEGKMPADSLLDGLAILIAGIFLITPGVLTDVVAIILLFPPARKPLRAMARKRFKKMLDGDGSMNFISMSSLGSSPFEAPTAGGPGQASPFRQSPFAQHQSDEDIIDVTPAGGDETEEANSAEEKSHREQLER